MSDYNNSTVNGPSCSYANLANYNNGSKGMSPPVPRTTVSGIYLVPDYDTTVNLVRGPGTCSGYPGIGEAYGKNAGNCDQKYLPRPCQ